MEKRGGQYPSFMALRSNWIAAQAAMTGTYPPLYRSAMERGPGVSPNVYAILTRATQ